MGKLLERECRLTQEMNENIKSHQQQDLRKPSNFPFFLSLSLFSFSGYSLWDHVITSGVHAASISDSSATFPSVILFLYAINCTHTHTGCFINRFLFYVCRCLFTSGLCIISRRLNSLSINICSAP